MNRTKQIRLVAEGLIEQSPDGPRLVGGRCRGCNTLSFPATPTFHRPDCPRREVEKVALSRSGRLVSYTIHRYQPPPPFRMEPFEPYAIGVAELPEKIQVIGILSGVPWDELAVGLKVELITERLFDDEEGNEVHTWKWKAM